MNSKHPDDDTLTLYVWGELAPEESEAVAQHLARCPACDARAAALRRAKRALDTLKHEAVLETPSVWPQVRRKLRRRRSRRWWPVAAAAALAAFLLWHQRSVPPKPTTATERTFAVLNAELGGRQARVFVFTPNDSVTTIWLE